MPQAATRADTRRRGDVGDRAERAGGASLDRVSRRSVLRTLAATGAVAAFLVGGPSPASALPALRVAAGLKVVYRLKTRGHRACRACRIHHRYVVGATLRALEGARAHPGCNCPIVRQVITIGEHAVLFPMGRGVADLRKV